MSNFFAIIVLGCIFIFGITKMYHLEGYEIGLSIFISLFVLWFILGFKRVIRNNREYEKSPRNSGSYPNFVNQTAGMEWTKKKNLESEKDKEENVYIDEFVYSWEMIKEFNLLHRFIFNFQKKEIYKKPLSFTRGSLVIGSMGSGKTVFFNSILYQKFYSRALIHDIKGDFVEKEFRHRDIILNPFDKRGTVWDVFEEVEKYPKIADSFLQSLLAGVLGSSEQNKNFFTSSAKERFVKIFHETQVQELESKEKWNLFIKKVELYFQEVEELNQKSEKDVVSTMKLLVEYLEYINYLIQKGTKTFTIGRWLKSNKRQKLFLLNNPTYSDFLTPYFSAFIDSFAKIFMAEMHETEEDFTLFLLDEYLSLLPLLSEDTKTILHTLTRSKGGCMMPGIQYLPEEKKLRQQLLNSAENIYLFQTSDSSTSSEIKEIIGKAEFSSENRSQNGVESCVESYATSKEYLLTDNILKEIGKDYSHITFTQSNQQLYRGYTKLLKKEKRNKAFEVGKFTQFIQEKYKK